MDDLLCAICEKPVDPAAAWFLKGDPEGRSPMHARCRPRSARTVNRAEAEYLLGLMFIRARMKLLTPKNLSKGLWFGMTDEEVRGRILDEVGELTDALHAQQEGRGTWESVALEAFDVYAMASMAADDRRTGRRR